MQQPKKAVSFVPIYTSIPLADQKERALWLSKLPMMHVTPYNSFMAMTGRDELSKYVRIVSRTPWVVDSAPEADLEEVSVGVAVSLLVEALLAEEVTVVGTLVVVVDLHQVASVGQLLVAELPTWPRHPIRPILSPISRPLEVKVARQFMSAM